MRDCEVNVDEKETNGVEGKSQIYGCVDQDLKAVMSWKCVAHKGLNDYNYCHPLHFVPTIILLI